MLVERQLKTFVYYSNKIHYFFLITYFSLYNSNEKKKPSYFIGQVVVKN